MTKKYNIEVDCASCANRMEMEMEINKLDEINSASINFMAAKLIVDFKDNVDIENSLEKIKKVCKKIDSDFELKK